MDSAQRQHLIDSHRDSLFKHGYSPQTLFWESRAIQQARFAALVEIGVQPDDSLIDVGCGFGDLRSWLIGRDMMVEYTGLDLSPDLIEKAQTLHRRARFYQGDIFDLEADTAAFDWAVLSGTLNWQLDDGGDYAKRVIARMFELCVKGVAFNMLDDRYFKGRKLLGLVAFDPEAMLDYCRTLSSHCNLRSDYLENDFTIYIYREAPDV